MTTDDSTWWKHGVIYQIYPRSFQDSNGDGLGDLAGITSRLDYLAGTQDSLGVDALWISPFYPSPMRDFGYDVSDYRDVDPRFGTLADFDHLLEEAHRRGLRIIIDLVLNHTSNEHPWFLEASSSRSAPRHDWYIWSEARRPNNWKSAFELASAWWPNPQTGEYYLGTFTRYQPEVNWRNPDLKEAMFDVMRFWLDRGVDGFRLDVVNWFLKDEQLRSNPLSLRRLDDLLQKHIYDRNRPETVDLCREMRALTDEYPSRMMVGEVYTDDATLAASYHGRDNDALHMAFNFNFLFQPWNARRFAEAAKEWYDALPPGAWPNFTLSNHDQPRHISRYAHGARTLARARVAAAMLLTLKGTPFLYYGEELGMKNSRVHRSELEDPLGRRLWPLPFGRDPQRAPMQWDASHAAGFTTGTPWLPLSKDFAATNVAAERNDPGSLLTFYRKLLALRRAHPELHGGELEFLVRGTDDCLVYRRYLTHDSGVRGRPVGDDRSHERRSDNRDSGDESAIVIALNLASRPRRVHLPAPSRVLLGTHRTAVRDADQDELDLAPLEVLVYQTGGQP